MKRELRPHQIRMQEYCMRTRNPKLFVDMRLGKTLVTVRTLANASGNVLIVGPYSVMGAWRKELSAERIPWTELYGSTKNKKEVVKTLSGWVLTNKEIWRSLPEIRDMQWQHRVIDESTFLKNPRSKVTKYFNGFLPEESDWRLTGTPNPESDLDFFGQTMDLWKHKNYFHWRNYWFYQSGFDWKIKPSLSKEFHQILRNNCFFMTRKDIGIDVERIYETRLVKFPAAIKRIYKKLSEEFILELPEGESWETEFAPVKYSWLRRLCGGAIPNQNEKEHWSGKLDLLLELLNGELAGQQVVIWAHFREEIERIYAALANSGEAAYIHGSVPPSLRDPIIKAFQSGAIKWVVGQASCLAHSTDFSCADTMVYYSSTESAEIRRQSERRIEAVSKMVPSLIIDLVVEDTIDEVIVKSLKKKESRSEMTRSIVNSLKGK
jgi:SNF2 family DNA or RNA helicase